jgi:nucleoside-diphosphate kinase
MTQMERTLTIIKPDAVRDAHTGAIIEKIESVGFKIVALKMLYLSHRQAESFYTEHRDKRFYDELIDYMTASAVVVAVLEKENAVEDYRRLVGETDPRRAERGTLRALYGRDVTQNALHASDSIHSARRECSFFFSESEMTI